MESVSVLAWKLYWAWCLSPVVNHVRYIRWRLLGKKGRMDAEQEKKFWEDVADSVLVKLDIRFKNGEITQEARQDFLNKLRRTSGLGSEFRARNWQSELKWEIIERRGTDEKVMQKVKALPFPDAKVKPRRLNLSIMGKNNAKS